MKNYFLFFSGIFQKINQYVCINQNHIKLASLNSVTESESREIFPAKSNKAFFDFGTEDFAIICSACSIYTKAPTEISASSERVLENLKDFADRLDFLSSKISEAGFTNFNEAANRIIRISKDYMTEHLPDKLLFNNTYEKQLAECTEDINADKLNYQELYNELSKSVKAIEAFFENVLVMDKDEKVKENRLTLLYSIKKKFEKIADFSKLTI